jgi:ABC-type transport system involved in cytochrome bd biosynthesis fused ATPase/permease subunit
MLHFTFSIWELKGQAISIERVRKYTKFNVNVERREKMTDEIIKKLKNNSNIETSDKILEIKKLTFAYESNPNLTIFKEMSFLFSKGDKIKIKGKSGAGKTTLFKILTSTYPSIFDET